MVDEDQHDITSLQKDLETLRKVRDDLEHEHQVSSITPFLKPTFSFLVGGH